MSHALKNFCSLGQGTQGLLLQILLLERWSADAKVTTGFIAIALT